MTVSNMGQKYQRKQAYGFHHNSSNLIRIRIACRSPVLKVALPSSSALSRYADTRSTVSDTPAEGVDVGCLMLAGHAVAVASP